MFSAIPLSSGQDEVIETALPCSASKRPFEASDWTLAAGAVLETLMQHQKWSSSLRTEPPPLDGKGEE